jgi:hypothetical protein
MDCSVEALLELAASRKYAALSAQAIAEAVAAEIGE